MRPSSCYFAENLSWVRAYADLRADRLAEIHIQLDDLLSYFGALAYLDESRRKYTIMMLDVARRLAIHVERQMKHRCRAPRPIDFAPEVQPIIQTPDHSSVPSGHATEAFTIATVFHRLSTGQGPQNGITGQALPFRLAHRIATNRTVAGVHVPIDSAVGAWLGFHIGEIFHHFATEATLACGDMPAVEFPVDDECEFVRNADGSLVTPDFLLGEMPPLARDRSITVTPPQNRPRTRRKRMTLSWSTPAPIPPDPTPYLEWWTRFGGARNVERFEFAPFRDAATMEASEIVKNLYAQSAPIPKTARNPGGAIP